MTDHARTHIKAMLEIVKEQPSEQLAQPAGLFISGMLTGLAASVQILNGSTAEAEMERIEERLSASIGRAYLNGTLPGQPDQEQAAPVDGQGCRCHNGDELCSSCRRCPDVCNGCDGPEYHSTTDEALRALIDVARKKMIEELGEKRAAPQGGEVPALEALGYHAMGLSYDLERATAERDDAYRERAHLVALLAAMTDGAVIAPAADVDELGWQIAYLTLGSRQASWHISPRDADLVAHIEPVEPGDPRAQWDGHTTEEKYAHIAALTAELMQRCGPACAEGHTYTGRCEGAHPHQVDDSEATAPDVVHPDVSPLADDLQQVDEPCVQHPTAPVIGGVCGGCTQYPADMVKPADAPTKEPGDAQH